MLPLSMLLSWGTSAAREQAAAALSRLVQGEPAARTEAIEAGAVAALLRIIRSDESDGEDGERGARLVGKLGGCKVEAASCLRCLIVGDLPLQAQLAHDGAIPAIAALLRHPRAKHAAAALLDAFDTCFGSLLSEARG